jgi:hypothetical protein
MSPPRDTAPDSDELAKENERLIVANKLLHHGFNEAIRQRDKFANLLFATQAEFQNLRNNQPSNRAPAPQSKQSKQSKENKDPQAPYRALSLLVKKKLPESAGREDFPPPLINHLLKKTRKTAPCG